MKSYDFFSQHLFGKENLKYLYSKFYFDINSYCEALNDVYDSSENEYREINSVIKNLCLSFSNKYNCTLSKKQQQLIDALDEKGRFVLFPYQPNIFPSISVMAPAVHMEVIREIMETKYNKRIIPLYMFVDYDNCMDNRFLKAYIPNPAKTNARRVIGHSIVSENKNDAIFKVSLPSINTVANWKNIFCESISNFSNIVYKCNVGVCDAIKCNVQKMLNIIDDAYGRANSFASFNELFIYDILINCWDCGILFFDGVDLYSSAKNVLLDIDKSRVQINRLSNEALEYFWQDEMKTSLSLRDQNRSFVWKYKSLCGMRCSEKSSCFEECTPEYMFPNVIADYLMDYIYTKKIGSVGYYKQFEATCVSEYILNKLYNIDSVPQFLSVTSLNVFDFINKNHYISIESEFNQLNYNFDMYLKACEDSHCSILYHASILGLQTTFEIIKKALNGQKIMEEFL